MEAYKEQVDEIVRLLFTKDSKAARANRNFTLALHQRQQAIDKICQQNPDIDQKSKEEMLNKIDEDYKRRVGNLVLKLARYIKPEYYERPKAPNGRYKANRIMVKRQVGISNRKINWYFKKFVDSFAKEVNDASNEYSEKAKDVEDETEEENRKKKKEGNFKG